MVEPRPAKGDGKLGLTRGPVGSQGGRRDFFPASNGTTLHLDRLNPSWGVEDLVEISCIYLDLDGVVVDLYRAICIAHGGTGDEPYTASTMLHCHVIWKEILPELTGEEWSEEKLRQFFEQAGMDFWMSLTKYPWADELWDLCNSVAPTVVMSNPWVVPSAAGGKMMWLRDNLSGLQRFALTDVKHHFSHPGALLIDDRIDSCEEFCRQKNPGQAYCFPQPWSAEDWYRRDPLAELRAFLL